MRGLSWPGHPSPSDEPRPGAQAGPLTYSSRWASASAKPAAGCSSPAGVRAWRQVMPGQRAQHRGWLVMKTVRTAI
jgi:hypothetical protein